VRPHPATGEGHYPPGVLGAEAKDLALEADLERAAEGALAVANGAGQDLGHAGVALHARRHYGLLGPGPHPGHQALDGGESHSRLAQRGQHVAHITEVDGVGPHHQDTLALEGEAMGVEEVGGPVQGHRRLPGARAALDHQHAGQLRADHLVLFDLDGRHDVAHAP
jgi:hypothetical protein